MGYYSPYLPYTIFAVGWVGIYFLIERYLTKPWMRRAWWSGSILLFIIVGWNAAQDQTWSDFSKGYYYGGRKILRDPGNLYDESCYGFVNLPLVAYLFVPLALLPKPQAGLIFFIIEYISLLPLAYWLVRLPNLTGWKRWLMLVLLLFSGPLDYSVRLGNITHIVLLGLLLALWWYREGREWLAGIFLGVNGLIKIPLILPAGYFAILSKWRVVAGGILIAWLTLVASILLIPSSLNQTWLERCILASTNKSIAAFNNQSTNGFLARELFQDSNVYRWNPIDRTPTFNTASNILLALFYGPIIILLFLDRKIPVAKSDQLMKFATLLVCSLLTSPISWTHYYTWFLLPVALYLGGTMKAWWITVLIGLGMILISIPIDLGLALFERTGARLFLSANFIGGCLFYLSLLNLWALERLQYNYVAQLR